MNDRISRYADYGTIADSLRKIADALDTFADQPMPRKPYVSLDIQPGASRGDDDDATIAAVSALAAALYGGTATMKPYSSGDWHYESHGVVPGISVSVYDRVTSPEERKLREEVEALRRERDALAADLAAGPRELVPGESIPSMPGYVVGKCGHRVAGSEWRAGFRNCERCGS